MRVLEPAQELEFADESRICTVILKRTTVNEKVCNLRVAYRIREAVVAR